MTPDERRPRIVHVISGLTTGGTEQALCRLIGHGLARHFDNHVVSLASEGTFADRLRKAGATVEALETRRNPISALNRLHAIGRTMKPDLIQGWMYHGNVGALAIGRTEKAAPVLWNIRQSLPDIRDEKRMTQQVIRLSRLLSRLPVQILYNSSRSRSQHEAFGLSSVRGLLIPNGFDLDRYATDEGARARIRRELKLSDSDLVFGQFARLHAVKDQTTLLTAADSVLRQGLDAHFLMAGRNVSFATTRLAEIVDPRFHHRFHMFGDRSDIPSLLQAIDVYVSSSRAEAFPNAIGEAMCAMKPCIGTDVGDTADIIGTSGIVVPPADPAAVAHAMSELGRNYDLRMAFSARARHRMQSKYDINSVVDQYTRLYQRRLEKPRGR